MVAKSAVPARNAWQVLWPALAAMALTPLALVAHSYKFAVDDQILYIPMLLRRLNPNLYPSDHLFVNNPQASISLFQDVLMWPVHWLGMDWTMFVVYVAVQWAILLAVYWLAEGLTGRKASAALAMVLFILPVSVGGTLARTYDNYLNPRTMTLPLGLLALIALGQRRVGWAALLAGLHLLLHPLSGIYPWLVTTALLGWWIWRGQLSRRRWFGPALVLFGTLGWLVWSSAGGDGLWLDETWRAVLLQRTSYMFLGSWRLTDWLSLATYAVLGVLGWFSRARTPSAAQICLASSGVAIGAILTAAIGADWLGLAPLASLQLARGGWLIIALGVVFGADLVVTLLRRPVWSAWLMAVLLATVIYHNRADEEWQLAFGGLVGAVLLAVGMEAAIGRLAGAGGAPTISSRLAEAVLAGSGVVAIASGLLAVWPVTTRWAQHALGWWALPAEALWPALFFFGLVWLTRTMRANYLSSRMKYGQLAASAVLVLLSCLPVFASWQARDWGKYLNSRLQLPGTETWMSAGQRAWRAVQLWAAEHTPPDALFVTDPDDAGFRVYSMRSPLVEWKDGAPSMFSRAYALEWECRMQAVSVTGVVDPDKQTRLTRFSEAGLLTLHERYPFDYVVARQPQELAWPLVYSNTGFVVFAWPQPARP